MRDRPVFFLPLVTALAVAAGFLIPVALKAQAGGRAVKTVPVVSAPALIIDEALKEAGRYTADWLMWTRTYDGQRFSPLNQVNRQNVKQLAPKWAFSLGTHGAQQCTPIVHNGVMYVTSTQGKLNAIDARTGELRWQFDSELPEDATKYGPDANRGAALYQDRVYWNNIIGTLFCHEAKTGKVVWKVTPDNYKLGFSKTFAPLIVKGKVITGIGGGEWGVRGFIEARDADSGKLAWKTYTIPAPGEPGSETWPKNNIMWEHGGAPTWITGTYDPALNTIYWATGNAGPWSSEQRPGDNLFCCCVLALNADTGKIKWHYQFIPNDDWDFDVNQAPILTEIAHEEKQTPVLAVANKGGFIWVLDRRDGKFLKATKFSETASPPFWAQGLDKNGRPMESLHARPKKKGERPFVAPSALGSANWWGLALDPRRNWLMIVANETGNDRVWDQPIVWEPGKEFVGWKEGEFAKATRRTAEKIGRISAYDLTANPPKKVWDSSVRELEPRWGGMLATAGDLVFSGTLRGYFQAFDSRSGKLMWQFQTGSGIMAHPVTYAVDGKQYVAIVSGKGGVANPASLSLDFFKHQKNHNSSGMVFAFALP